MEYMAGDLVELRGGQRTELEKNDNEDFPLRIKDPDGSWPLTKTGNFYLGGEPTPLDAVKLIHRPPKEEKKLEESQTKLEEQNPLKRNEILPCGLTKLEYFVLHQPIDNEYHSIEYGEELIGEKRTENNRIDFSNKFEAKLRLLRAKAMLKAIKEDKGE